MSDKPLMPKATAVWLIDNTSLSFEQMADFCGMHPLEVKGIADEDVAKGIKGIDPIATGQLTREEIEDERRIPTTACESPRPNTSCRTSKRRRRRATRPCRSGRTNPMRFIGCCGITRS